MKGIPEIGSLWKNAKNTYEPKRLAIVMKADDCRVVIVVWQSESMIEYTYALSLFVRCWSFVCQ